MQFQRKEEGTTQKALFLPPHDPSVESKLQLSVEAGGGVALHPTLSSLQNLLDTFCSNKHIFLLVSSPHNSSMPLDCPPSIDKVRECAGVGDFSSPKGSPYSGRKRAPIAHQARSPPSTFAIIRAQRPRIEKRGGEISKAKQASLTHSVSFRVRAWAGT